jgi:hypothetical protein
LTEYVPGVSMRDLAESDKEVVKEELLKHIETLQGLRSDAPGVPGQELLCPPLRVNTSSWKVNSCWKPKLICQHRIMSLP